MDDLLSIGAFSELTGLSVKALRLYDRRGLLRPALVDFESGYRYYSRDQTKRAQQIRLLRQLAVPLAEAQILLDASDEQVLREYLDRHRTRLQTRLRETKRALKMLPMVEEWRTCAGKEDVMGKDDKTHQCSFCSKWNTEVRRMIAGPGGVVICNECVSLCNEVLAKEETKESNA